MDGIKAIIFDIDGTLTTVISWTYLTEKLGVSVDEHRRLFRARRQGELNEKQSKGELLALWQSSGNATKRKFEEIFSSVPLREEAREIVVYLRRKYLICLITGSMDLYAEIIAKRLGVEHFFSNTQLLWNGTGDLTDFFYDVEQAQKKLLQFQEFCRNQKVDARQCVVVGDSGNDRELFRVTGHGIAVRTEYEEKELEGLSWKMISNLDELKSIL